MQTVRRQAEVFLLRHGMPKGGVRYRGTTDDPLSSEGWVQMERAVSRCHSLDRVVTSPMRRCADFAKEFARRHGLSCETELAFREMHFGSWEGLTPEALTTTHSEAARNFRADPIAFPPPGGEPLPDFSARVLSAWNGLTEGIAHERVLLIAHGGTIRVILGRVRKLSLAEMLRLDVPFGSLHPVNLENVGKRVVSCGALS